MKKDNFYLSKITYNFIQEGNTDGTTCPEEELIVEVEGPVGSIEREGGYMVIKTVTGWSINDSSELLSLLKLIESGVPSLN